MGLPCPRFATKLATTTVSFPRKREPLLAMSEKKTEVPAFAGMTLWEGGDAGDGNDAVGRRWGAYGSRANRSVSSL